MFFSGEAVEVEAGTVKDADMHAAVGVPAGALHNGVVANRDAMVFVFRPV